ncbi:hypothetical protein BS78_K001900 [Paspalum vaginatum]|uniref:MADS-box domain-containing protein n=1 Tax=Paspalum vaginatum TaxID=158149 RepID=A0A9W7X9P5_9POAL|nr:hypothetical protein BS78_K001900 [Paspalum vaginatum]
MPRGKLGMKLIESPKKRRATYKNRRAGLLQKAEQLATLCGIDVLLVCFDPHDAAAAAVTTWPADRDAALRLVRRYRETPPDKIKHDLSAATYYQEELAKQQRKLVKTERRGPPTLAPEDARLAGLSADEACSIIRSLDEALLKVQRRIVALGGRVVVHDDDVNVDLTSATAMVTVPAPPHGAPVPLAADYNSFDLAYSMPPDAGAMVPQYCYPPHRDMLAPPPCHLQPPCLGYQMPPPGFMFQFQTPTTLMPPLDFDVMTTTGTMGVPPFTTNFANAALPAAGFYYDGFVPGFNAMGGGIYVDDYVAGGHGFAAGHVGTVGYQDDAYVAGGHGFAAGAVGVGYQDEHRRTPAGGVGPVSRLNSNLNPMAADDFQLSDFALACMPGSSSSSSSNLSNFQGGFQKK